MAHTENTEASDRDLRKARVAEMLEDGQAIDQIAAELGVSPRTVIGYVRELRLEMVRRGGESLDRVRERMQAELEAMVDVMWDRIAEGDAKAANTLIASLKQQCELLGLNAPTKVDHRLHVEIEQRISERDARLVAILAEEVPPDALERIEARLRQLEASEEALLEDRRGE